ncbi:MAG: hydrogenase expression/formation protein HypE [candidate division Zixibacteria bacterium]|nr:hydrogenase expression/formation protein HypE [candidate division Zixibacteria bacterium]
MNDDNDPNLNCPVPISDYPRILLAHGGGGKLMHQLIDRIFATAFKNPYLETRHDGAVLETGSDKIVLTTDSYVVHPLFFPGGDIGSLAVNGTVNDLAMCGARPLYLSAGFIIEEGFPMEDLWRVARSMQQAADSAGVSIVTGDTKVVDKGRGHGVFINTAGVGILEHNQVVNPGQVRAGDAVIINGDIGRHGIAIMAQREGLDFETEIESDCAPLSDSVQELIKAEIEIHCLRDLTRGGLATSLVEIAESSGRQIWLDEKTIPVRDDIRGACEILGFEACYVANEGRFTAFVAEKDAAKAVEILRTRCDWPEATVIGRVTEEMAAEVIMKSVIGAERVLDMLSGEQLPRIC